MNDNSVESLVREDLADLKPYQSARRIGGKGNVFINANESPFNNVETADLNFDSINRYPEQQPQGLINAYADYAKVSSENIVCTRGADEAIELLIRTFCNVGRDSISYFGPSYGMYRISAKTCGIESIELQFNSNYSLPIDWKNETKSKLTFICNPNNPTGTLLSIKDIEKALVSNTFGLVVVDEAYIEFASEASVITLINAYPNLVVLRTLSKAFALAGLRCGFLIASKPITEQVLKVLAPYPISVPVEQIALKALSASGLAKVTTQVKIINDNKTKLENCIKRYSTCIYASSANFIYAEFADAENLWSILVNNEVIARQYAIERLANGIRFTIGSETENQFIIKLFEQKYSALTCPVKDKQ